MKARTLAMWSGLFVLFIIAEHTAAQTFKVSYSVFGGGGAVIADSNHRMISTLGQPLIGTSQNSENIHKIGFWYPVQGFITAVQGPVNELPSEFRLEQNYPNPFNPSTVIRYQLPASSRVEISIYSLHGQKVRTLLAAEKPAGFYEIDWDGRDDRGKSVATGVYFYRLLTDGFVETKKLLVLR